MINLLHPIIFFFFFNSFNFLYFTNYSTCSGSSEAITGISLFSASILVARGLYIFKQCYQDKVVLGEGPSTGMEETLKSAAAVVKKPVMEDLLKSLSLKEGIGPSTPVGDGFTTSFCWIFFNTAKPLIPNYLAVPGEIVVGFNSYRFSVSPVA